MLNIDSIHTGYEDCIEAMVAEVDLAYDYPILESGSTSTRALPNAIYQTNAQIHTSSYSFELVLNKYSHRLLAKTIATFSSSDGVALLQTREKPYTQRHFHVAVPGMRQEMTHVGAKLSLVVCRVMGPSVRAIFNGTTGGDRWNFHAQITPTLSIVAFAKTWPIPVRHEAGSLADIAHWMVQMTHEYQSVDYTFGWNGVSFEAFAVPRNGKAFPISTLANGNETRYHIGYGGWGAMEVAGRILCLRQRSSLDQLLEGGAPLLEKALHELVD